MKTAGRQRRVNKAEKRRGGRRGYAQTNTLISRKTKQKAKRKLSKHAAGSGATKWGRDGQSGGAGERQAGTVGSCKVGGRPVGGGLCWV